MTDEQSGDRQLWDAIDLDLSAELSRLVDRKVLTGSQAEELRTEFRSVEARVASRLLSASTSGNLSRADQLRVGLRARMWLATAIEAAVSNHEHAVAIRQRIVALEKSLGVYTEPELVDRPRIRRES